MPNTQDAAISKNDIIIEKNKSSHLVDACDLFMCAFSDTRRSRTTVNAQPIFYLLTLLLPILCFWSFPTKIYHNVTLSTPQNSLFRRMYSAAIPKY